MMVYVVIIKFIMASTISIIEVFNVFTNYSGLLYLNNSRENAQGSQIEIYDSNITNSNMAFEMYIQESDSISIHDCNFIDASMNTYSGDDGYSSYNNAQLSIDTCNFYNYVDRNAFKMDTNSETWVFSMNVTNSNFYDNDNDRTSETSALIGFYDTNTNTDIISYARFDTCNFYRNKDLFSIVEDSNINN